MAVGDYSPLISSQLAGRIQPQQWQAPDGSWVLLIGAPDTGRDEDVEVGDYYGLKQTLDLTDVYLISFAIKFRQSADSMTVGFKARVLVDGVEEFALSLPPSVTMEYVKRTINVTSVTGSVDVEFRLEAVSP
jgi:hypothetical protein